MTPSKTSTAPLRHVPSWIARRRVLVTIAALALVVVLGGVYVTVVAMRPGSTTSAAPMGQGSMLFVDMSDGRSQVEQTPLADPGSSRSATGMSCQRVYSAGGTTVCLRLAGLGPTFEAVITGRSGQTLKTVPLPGIPSRARVSASGRVVTWTSFVTGDSYSVPGGFSTRSGYFDVQSGKVVDSVEHFSARVNGEPLVAADANFWGITVAADDRTFYATLASGGRTWLVSGDLAAGVAQDVRPDAECPSLSPDGTRVAYKKRIGRLGPWDLAVLDLRTRVESRLPGTVGIDDQAVWLDDGTLAYGNPGGGSTPPSIMSVPADGSAPSRLLIANASSPVPWAEETPSVPEPGALEGAACSDSGAQ